MADQKRTVVHWALIRYREGIEAYSPDDVEQQALHCPHYVPLSGEWGSDWGAIMHPQSKKFGQLVFEHEWCGCPTHQEVEPRKSKAAYAVGTAQRLARAKGAA